MLSFEIIEFEIFSGAIPFLASIQGFSLCVRYSNFFALNSPYTLLTSIKTSSTSALNLFSNPLEGRSLRP